MGNFRVDPILVALFTVFVSTSAINCVSLGANGQIETDNLMKIIGAIKQPPKMPITSDDVLAAYNEYVGLHSIQSELTSHFEGAKADEQSVAEKKYAEVGNLLQRPELQILNLNLFNVIQDDYTAGRVSMTNKLRTQLDSAIESMF